MSKKEVIAIRKTILPGTDITISERIKAPGTVEEMRVRFYPGQQRELHVTPYISHKGDKTEQMVTYPAGTETFLSGDDDNLIFPCVVSVDNDDILKIRAENKSATYSYTLVVDVVIDYFAGKNRVVGGGVVVS